MAKSNSSDIPGMSMMTDTLDFFKNMWESVPGMNLPGMKHIPGMVMPTLSVEEVDKQIKDLKSVESWLTLNLSMLQGTIQALEVQKATLSTLHTMGETFTAAMQPPSMSASADKPVFHSPFTAPSTEAARDAGAAEKAPKPEPEKPARQTAAKAEKAEPPAEPVVTPPAGTMANAMEQAAGSMADAMQPLANPAAWWGMLQDQFKQAVDSAAAMTPETPAGTAKRKAAASAGADAGSTAPRRRKSTKE